MDFYKNLLKNKNTYTGRLDMAVFFVNVFLIVVHIFLSVFYLLVGHKLMFIVNLISIGFYLTSFKFSIKYKDLFLKMSFVEIWMHTLLGICSFGWEAYFQNWIFALVAASFLPTFNPEDHKKSYRQSFMFSFILLLSYYLFALMVNKCDIPFMIELSDNMKDFIFAFNNIVAFSAIIMFAITYTKNNETREFELIRRANFDELTGIYNRNGFDTIESALLSNNKQYSIAILDIDFFKNVNDTYGHKSGDLVLKKIGMILESNTSKYITVGRWGGEEFVIIGNSGISYEEFTNLLEKIRIDISNTKFVIRNKKKINITVSLGSKYIKDGKCIEEAVSRADVNLYKAKKTGRNKLVS